MKHALIDVATITDLGKRHDFDGGPIPDLTHKTPEVRWVPVVVSAPPTFDAATESREIRALPQEEIDRLAEQADHASKVPSAALIASFNAGTAHDVQTQKAVAWLLRKQLGAQ